MKKYKTKALALTLALLMLLPLGAGAFASAETPSVDTLVVSERRHPDKTGDEALLYDYLADDLMRLTECEETFDFLYDGMPISFPPSDVPYRPEQIAVLMLGVAPRTWEDVAYARPIPSEAVGYVYGATVDAVEAGFFRRAWNWLTTSISPMSALPESGHITNHGYVTAGTQGTSGGRYTITIDGVQIPAFCNNRNIPGPATGASHRIMGLSNEQTLRALYFGWGGPGNIFGPNQIAEGVLSTTVVTSYIAGHTGSPATHNLQGARDLWARVQNTTEFTMRHNVQGIFIDVLAAGSQNLVAIRVLPDPEPTPTPTPDPDPDPGQVRIIKTSESGVVAGIQFRITGNGVNQTVTTGADGTITIPDLQPGTYTVTEINLGSRYAPQPPQTVTVVANQTATVTFHNRLSTGGLRIVKTSESGVVAGIQFRITGNGVNQTVTTGADGSITVPGLQPGTYTVTEINLGSQYEPQPPQTVTVVANQTATVTFQNRLQPGEIRIVKTSESGIVTGVQFRIAGNGVNQTVTTGADGTITIPDLRAGTYTVAEINLGAQYVQPSAQTVTVRPNETATVTFNNVLLRGRVEGLKVGEDAGTFRDANGLAGATIGLFAHDETEFTEEAALYVAVTAANGSFAFADLLYGRYIVREIAAPTGYTLNDTAFPIYVNRANLVIEVRIENTLIRGDIEGVKVGEDTDGMLDSVFADADGLVGALIGLFAPEEEYFTEETALETAITGEYGHFAFRALPYGDYLIREIAPPEAYVLNDTVLPVTIAEDGVVIEVSIENTLIRGRVDGIKTGETTYGKLAGLFADRDGLAGATIGLFGLVKWELVVPDYEPDEEYDEPENEQESEPENDENDDQEIELLPTSEDTDDYDEDNQDEQEESEEDEESEENEEDTPEVRIVSIAGISLEDFVFTSENAVQTAVTSEDGSFSFDGVIVGTYVVREVYAPRGYILNETLFLVTIAEDGEIITVEIENELIRGDIEGIKVGEDTKAPFEGMFTDGNGLASAVIGLFHEDEIEFTEANVIQLAITDEYGHFVFRDVIFGRFIVREIAPPEGYVLNDTPFPVEVTEDDQAVEVTIENLVIRGRIEGIKVCSTTGYPLEGATFGLFASDETTLTADTALITSTSGVDGIFSFENVPFGAYLVREIVAPEGYLLSDETFQVEIGYDGQIVDIRAENEPEAPVEPEDEDDPKEPTPTPSNRPGTTAPQTGDETSLPWLVLILSGLGITTFGFWMVRLHGKNKAE